MKPDPFRDGPLLWTLRYMFNDQFEEGRAALKDYLAMAPLDPLAHGLSAAVLLYHHAGSKFATGRGHSIFHAMTSAGIEMPANIGEIEGSIQESRRLARIDLEADRTDQNALLALCMAEGTARDSAALLYRRWVSSLDYARAAGASARRLLEVNAGAYDAYYVIGISEYVLSRLPGIVGMFATIPGIVGDMTRAVQFLEATAAQGYYLRDFARQALVSIHMEHRRAKDAVRVLEGLTRDFPGNSGYRAELAKLRAA